MQNNSDRNPTQTLKKVATRSPLIPLVGILVAIAVAVALKATATVIVPFVIALFLTYLIDPMVSGLRRLRVPEVATIPLVIVILLFALLLLYLILFNTVSEITERAPEYIASIEEMIDGILVRLGPHAEVLRNLDWLEKLSAAGGSFAATFFGSVVSFVANLVLVMMYTGFILAGRKGFAKRIVRAFDEERAHEIHDILRKIHVSVQRYIVTKILVSMATGFLMFFFLEVFGVDFALFWGLLGFLLNFIPSVGSVIACFFPITLSLVQFGDNPLMAVWIGLILLTIQIIIGNVIEPMVQGRRLNLSPLVVLFSLVFFGWLWGFWGMVLSVPLMSSIKIAMEQTNLKPFAVMMESDWDLIPPEPENRDHMFKKSS